ncbi:hypothetical protein GALMADRAFT_916200 [Galerina marginata CBS 339.88]|uniref:Uncharacterized protein n=1 Tax=Galerina marginata (strain CBS 339.88) TaxID=685588 RepID=A0A067SS32_GALM3|nr:hypothetical protein GALMADRAFT_916200 [Galerina marginata CBS 339.88]
MHHGSRSWTHQLVLGLLAMFFLSTIAAWSQLTPSGSAIFDVFLIPDSPISTSRQNIIRDGQSIHSIDTPAGSRIAIPCHFWILIFDSFSPCHSLSPIT